MHSKREPTLRRVVGKMKLKAVIVHALNSRYPPDTGGVGLSDRPCSVGGFGGTGGGF